MIYKLLFSFLLCIVSLTAISQPDAKKITIVDSLTAEQKINRNPVLLKSELDSLITLFNTNTETKIREEYESKTATQKELFIVIFLSIATLLVFLQIAASLVVRRRRKELIDALKRQQSYLEFQIASISRPHGKFSEFGNQPDNSGGRSGKEPELKGRKQFEEKIATLKKLSEEYKNKYEAIKSGLTKTFKVKNYPVTENNKTEEDLLLEFLESERAFTTNVYEKFIKPINNIADTNKNAPASMGQDETNKLLELLISLSLLYIEYLYLRITDLSVGGRIVSRINDIKNGSGINTSTLKNLNTEHGSRALVLYMALSKFNIEHLSYPVFDETNLNKQ